MNRLTKRALLLLVYFSIIFCSLSLFLYSVILIIFIITYDNTTHNNSHDII